MGLTLREGRKIASTEGTIDRFYPGRAELQGPRAIYPVADAGWLGAFSFRKGTLGDLP
jgi:hypothetical protein